MFLGYFYYFFFFKQKTAYEMRISDWSSDVCSSDLVGYRFASDWRPTRVPVTVGDRTVDGLHLIQMFHYLNGDPEEFLVTYPSDGYWRAKPLPPAGRKETAYGTSFLVGPLREDGRPVAGIARLAIDPGARSYRHDFVDGTVGRLSVAEISRHRAAVDRTRTRLNSS